jgi:hypothetical protein
MDQRSPICPLAVLHNQAEQETPRSSCGMGGIAGVDTDKEMKDSSGIRIRYSEAAGVGTDVSAHSVRN